ncbi:MAG: HAD-IA family hydrolase [Deltaproteobacteria bacterium]|nr:HAD-IA family hydrolase [Deltaproteobacteria bacterium]
MRNIQAISLDVGWTLAYPQESMWAIFADLCTSAGVRTDPTACEQLVRSLWTFGQTRAEEHFRSGAEYADSDEDFAAQFATLGGIIFAQLGVADGHSELMQRFLQRFWSRDNWQIFPDVIESLHELRGRGLRLGVLSNAPTDLPLLLDQLGISPLLDFCVVSARAGVKKPDRRVFAMTVQRAGVAAESVLHVGDMYLEDIVGGAAAGLNTLLIERGNRALFPNFRESEGRTIESDKIVSDLSQVLQRL